MRPDILVAQHVKDKQNFSNFKKRRLPQWNENYTLYRDRVQTNRLTQRQAVNIPIIRDTIQSWISKIDEQPQLVFETRGREPEDETQELLINEMWRYTEDTENLDLKDNLEKKNVGLQGRGFKFWYFKDNAVKVDVIDAYDIDIDPRVSPFELNTAHNIIHKHIFVPLRYVLANPTYDPKAKNILKGYLDSKEGLIAAAKANEEADMRRLRLESIGVTNFDDLRVSDVLVELNRSYKNIWVPAENRFVRHLVVFAMDNVVLYCKPLKKALGIERLPFTSWASDPDLNDFWSDGIADNVRTMNKVINMYFSQDLENRAYRNFGMFFYDTKKGTFAPQGFDPKPFGLFGVDGNPSEVIQQVRIEPLADTQPSIEYFKNLIQSTVAQTPTERGVQEKTGTTLGEVQLSLRQSQTRQQVVAKQYRDSWRDGGQIWYELLNANAKGRFTLYKKGSNGKMYSKDVYPTDWQNPKGYECRVVLKSEHEAEDDLDFKKTQYIKASFQTNPVAMKIAKRKELEILGWSPDEIQQVMQAEDAQQSPAPSMQLTGAPSDAAQPSDTMMTEDANTQS